jgi:hypothetical protein
MSLKKVAAKMHQEALKNGVSRRKLNGGLMLGLWYRDDDIVLGLRRHNVRPSETEVKTCASVFFFDCPIEKRSDKAYSIWVAVKKEAIYGRFDKTQHENVGK